MADWYCDPTLAQAAFADYSSTPVAAGTVPTKPEDGNGKAAGVAVMATYVINFTGQPSAGQSVTVAGVAFTAQTSGATGNQFNIGATAAATATNLRNAINASTTNATQPAGAIAAAAPLRNLVNATVSGSVVTVYTRIAGSEWNSVTENSTLSNVTLTQWSGGADGAWGYFFNPAAIAWPGSVAAGTYGAFVSTYTGLPAAGDTIYVRSRRGGNDVRITWPVTALVVTARSVGTMAAPLTILIDDGSVWAGGAGVFTMSMDGSLGVNRFFQPPLVAGWFQIWAGRNLSDTSRSWRWEITGLLMTSNFNLVLGQTSAGDRALYLLSHEITGAAGAALNNPNSTHPYVAILGAAHVGTPRDAPRVLVRDLIYRSAGRVSPLNLCLGTTRTQMRAEGCLFDHTGLTLASDDAVISGVGVSGLTTTTGRFEAIGCRWVGFPATANQSGFQKYAARYLTAILRDCTFENIKMFGGPSSGGLVGTTEEVAVDSVDILRSISVVSALGNRPFIFENARKAIGWFDSAAPKTASSLLPDGVTPFSLRTTVTTEAGNVTKDRPVKFPRMSKINSLSDGDRTATLRLLVDQNIETALGSRAPRNDEMWVEVAYIGTDGNPKLVRSRPAIGAAPASISAGNSGDWSATSYDVNGVTHNYTAYEISVALPGVKGATELGMHFLQGIQSSSVDNLVFLDPEWGLA